MLLPSRKHSVDGIAKLVDLKAWADVAKLVDARDLKSLGLGCTGSTPVVRTNVHFSNLNFGWLAETNGGGAAETNSKLAAKTFGSRLHAS